MPPLPPHLLFIVWFQRPVLSAGSLFRLRFFSVTESTLGTLFSYGLCMIHGLLYTLVAFLPQKGGRLGFVHLEVMVHHGGNTWQEWGSRVSAVRAWREMNTVLTLSLFFCLLCYSSLQDGAACILESCLFG